MSPSLSLYQHAARFAQQQNWELAADHLLSAYETAPPRQLSAEDCRLLEPYGDDLAYVGQQLPCLSPTIELFARFVALRPTAP